VRRAQQRAYQVRSATRLLNYWNCGFARDGQLDISNFTEVTDLVFGLYRRDTNHDYSRKSTYAP